MRGNPENLLRPCKSSEQALSVGCLKHAWISLLSRGAKKKFTTTCLCIVLQEIWKRWTGQLVLTWLENRTTSKWKTPPGSFRTKLLLREERLQHPDSSIHAAFQPRERSLNNYSIVRVLCLRVDQPLLKKTVLLLKDSLAVLCNLHLSDYSCMAY